MCTKPICIFWFCECPYVSTRCYVQREAILFFAYIYIYGSPPPQGPPEREGMYHLPSVMLNTFKDMLRKHCKFQCFMHILFVLF